MMYNAAKITTNPAKLEQKNRKNCLEMIAPMQLKAVFEFLNLFAE